MASFTLDAATIFPEGTTVGAYPASGWPASSLPPAVGVAPVPSATASGAISSGAVTFTGLTDGATYYAGAQVGGVWRYTRVVVPAAPSSTYAESLAPTAVKTGAYTASRDDYIPVDASGGSVTITLPASPPDKTRIGVKLIATAGSNTCTIARGGSDVFNKTGGSTSLSLSLVNQGVVLQYQASTGIWYAVSTDVPLSGLDARYVAGEYTDMGLAASGPVTANVPGTYIFSPNGGAAAVGAITTGAYAFAIDPADYLVPAGKTLKVRVRASAVVNAVAPTNTITLGLYPVATFGGASGASPTIATLGTVVSGSTAAIAAPPAAGPTTQVSSVFTFPAAGLYVFGAVLTAGGAANSLMTVNARLQRVFA